MDAGEVEIVVPSEASRPFVRRYLYANRRLDAPVTVRPKPTGYSYFLNNFGLSSRDPFPSRAWMGHGGRQGVSVPLALAYLRPDHGSRDRGALFRAPADRGPSTCTHRARRLRHGATAIACRYRAEMDRGRHRAAPSGAQAPGRCRTNKREADGKGNGRARGCPPVGVRSCPAPR